MKKGILVLIAAAFALSLTACSTTGKSPNCPSKAPTKSGKVIKYTK